jgi:cyclophilin family peptidyl-prolyl cis-trans isomerase
MNATRLVRLFGLFAAALMVDAMPAFAQKPVVTEIAVVKTSMGTFEIGLYRTDAPKTVENFVQLAKKKFFNGMRVHRVAKGFVLQAGDDKSKDPAKVNEWGTGGQSIYPHKVFDPRTNAMVTRYTFNDELDPATPSYKEGYVRGVVAMANAGPNTNTSQFFVMLNDNTTLPKNYTIFGKVVKGMDVVEKIGSVEIVAGPFGGADGRPKQDIMLESVSIKSSAKASP